MILLLLQITYFSDVNGGYLVLGIFDLVKVFLNMQAITPGCNLSGYANVFRIVIFKEAKLRLMNMDASVISAEFSHFHSKCY